MATAPDPSLVARLERHGQGHLLRFWPELDPTGRARLAAEIGAIDLGRLDQLVATLVRDSGPAPLDLESVEPVAVRRLPHTDSERTARRRAAEEGEAMLTAGEVAALVVAGGQGTRLGFDGPKGTFPIGPVSGASLFEIHAEKLVALGRRCGRPIPLYVMTSPENHDDTARFFDDHDRFGLDHVRLFPQGRMPAVDTATGKILLAAPDRLALSPDGHGGTIAALAAPDPGGSPSCFDELDDRGIRTLFYFQVDNPLVRVVDPAFLGLHRRARADIAFKVVEKVAPDEKVGVVVAVGGRPLVIEYSDLPRSLAERREPDGGLRFWAGSIAIHAFEVDFLRRLAADGGRLPFHRALKKVPYVDDRGRRVDPESPNAVKFETFIFDALPLADRWELVETDRRTEFEPLKNASGPDSPESVRRRMTELFAGWLENAGATVHRAGDGSIPFPVEISPRFALDAAELKAKLPPGLEVAGPTYLGEPGP